MAEPSFTWGLIDGLKCVSIIHECYSIAAHWRPTCNLLRVPSGKVGEAFVHEMSRFFNTFSTASALESMALTAALLLRMLVLQRPSRKLKSKEIIFHIERRLLLWQAGSFRDLISEGESIQARLPPVTKCQDKKHLARLFGDYMMDGKVKSALNVLTHKSKGSVLSLDQLVDPQCPSSGLIY